MKINFIYDLRPSSNYDTLTRRRKLPKLHRPFSNVIHLCLLARSGLYQPFRVKYRYPMVQDPLSCEMLS